MSRSEDLIVWSRKKGLARLAARCGHCGGHGRHYLQSIEADNCAHCEGLGWFGIDPEEPVSAQPGSVERIAMMSVRYASGVRLWNGQDRVVDERTARSLEATAAAERLNVPPHESVLNALSRLTMVP